MSGFRIPIWKMVSSIKHFQKWKRKAALKIGLATKPILKSDNVASLLKMVYRKNHFQMDKGVPSPVFFVTSNTI